MQDARFLGLSFALLACGLLAGCPRGAAAISPVSGKVLYNGFPLPGGTIVFTPDASRGESGPIAHGMIGSDGVYQLSTGETPGVAPGKYRVTVRSHVSAAKPLPGERFAIPASLIPEKYSDPELSLLVCEVKPGHPNVIDFDLK